MSIQERFLNTSLGCFTAAVVVGLVLITNGQPSGLRRSRTPIVGHFGEAQVQAGDRFFIQCCATPRSTACRSRGFRLSRNTVIHYDSRPDEGAATVPRCASSLAKAKPTRSLDLLEPFAEKPMGLYRSKHPLRACLEHSGRRQL
jgi:hypothetical protein